MQLTTECKLLRIYDNENHNSNCTTGTRLGKPGGLRSR